MARKTYSQEEKAIALKKMAKASVSSVAKELGINRITLANWKKQAESAVKPAKKGNRSTAAKAKKSAKPAAEIFIQSPVGGNITPAEILAKTGPVEKIYIRVDENKAYWVRGEEAGSVDLW